MISDSLIIKEAENRVKLRMRQLARFLVGLFMPVFLIIGGGALAGVGINNSWAIIGWIGVAMVIAGIIWGLFLFLWASGGDI